MTKHLFGDTAVLTGRSLRHITRSLDTIITTTLMPIAFLLLFVFVFGGAINSGSDSYVNYLLPGILLITAASGVSYTAFRLFLDMKSGIFERFQSMPIARSSVLWAHVLTSLVAIFMSLVIVVLVALLMGFRSGAGVPAWLAVAGILILFTLMLTWIAVIGCRCAASHFRSLQATARVYVDTQTVLKPLMSGLAVQPNVDEQISMLARTLIARPNIEKIMRSSDHDVTATTQLESDRLVDYGHLTHQVHRCGSREHLQHLLPGRQRRPREARRPRPALALRRIRCRQQEARLRGCTSLHRRTDQRLREETGRSRESRQGIQDQERRVHRQRAGLLFAHERTSEDVRSCGWNCVSRSSRATR